MKYKTPNLETQRIVLKQGTFDDFVKVYEYDFRKLRDIAGEFEFVKQDPQELVGFDTYASDNDDVIDWILYLKRDMEPIGNITADRIEKEINAIELSFNLHPIYWGQGYMQEAVIKVMEYLFKLGFDNILCGYSEGNIKSKKLIDKVGFEFYKKEENAWQKNGISITEYQTIMSKKRFLELYGNEENL